MTTFNEAREILKTELDDNFLLLKHGWETKDYWIVAYIQKRDYETRTPLVSKKTGQVEFVTNVSGFKYAKKVLADA